MALSDAGNGWRYESVAGISTALPSGLRVTS
jgi:hypothetical protein